MERLDICDLANTALEEMGKILKRKPLRIVDATGSPYKLLEVSLLMEKEEMEQKIDDIKQRVIIPATFAIVNKINRLGPSWNTIVRINPEQKDESKWARSEFDNISVVVTTIFSLKHTGETMSVALKIAKDINWEANEWIMKHYVPVKPENISLSEQTSPKCILIYGKCYEVSDGDYNHYIDLRIK
jgi:hypothetical protein